MTFVNSIISDLRERRLWPLAVVLLAGIVAVPVVLAKSSPKVPVAAAPQGSTASGPGLPVVSVSSLQSNSRLKGSGRDPFAQQRGTSTTSTSATVTTSPAGGTGGTGTGGTGGTGTTGGTGGTATAHGGTTTTPSGSGTTTTPTTPIVPTHPAKPAPTGLTSSEAYEVTVSITHGSGVDKIGSLERLGTLPSAQLPLLVELGVLKGGRQVLFAVQPGTVISGPGTCSPGPINCQVLSLAPDQIESVARNTASGVVGQAMFAVTAITAHRFSSSGQASRARSQVSAVGRRLLSHSTASALSLFPYKPGLGALVDLRDLTIGGN